MKPHSHDPVVAQIGLTWGIRRSFIRYISGLPDGAHATFDGAYLCDGSFFTFPSVDDRIESEPYSDLAFRGVVRIAGHGGMLDVLVADPGIEYRSGEAVLTIVDPSQWPDRHFRLALARLTPVGESSDAAADPLERRWTAALTEAGTAVFGGNYPSGTTLDPVIVGRT